MRFSVREQPSVSLSFASEVDTNCNERLELQYSSFNTRHIAVLVLYRFLRRFLHVSDMGRVFTRILLAVLVSGTIDICEIHDEVIHKVLK